MGRLSCTGIVSLDGYINDATGNFDWAAPSEEVHAFVNDLERPIGTYLYGRRLYETMVAWETMPPSTPEMDDYTAIWRDADKVVFSSSLASVSSERTILERSFSTDYVASVKGSSPKDISIGGPTLAAQAVELIDDVHLFLNPVIVGGGTPFFPSALVSLSLANSHVFGNGVVYLHYRRVTL
jgi:dihydrofolate reductase